MSQNQPFNIKKPLLTAVSWAGRRASKGFQGRATSVSQVVGVSDMAPDCCFCGGRVQRRDKGLCPIFCLEESCPPVPALMPDTSVPSCISVVPFKLPLQCYSSEWVWVSLCVGSLRGVAWDSRNFFHQLYPRWFLQPKVMGSYLPDAGTLGWRA